MQINNKPLKNPWKVILLTKSNEKNPIKNVLQKCYEMPTTDTMSEEFGTMWPGNCSRTSKVLSQIKCKFQCVCRMGERRLSNGVSCVLRNSHTAFGLTKRTVFNEQTINRRCVEWPTWTLSEIYKTDWFSINNNNNVRFAKNWQSLCNPKKKHTNNRQKRE